MKIDIDKLSEGELVDLNNRIVERLRFLAQMRIRSEMLQFSIGERVTFTAEGARSISGIFTRYNRKTVTVIADDGQRWNVSPGLLSKAETTETRRVGTGKVIYLKKKE